MPVNSIWEGSGNVMCLDVLRALQRTPEAADALRAELAPARGADARLDAFLARLDIALAARPDEAQARRLVEMIVLAVPAAPPGRLPPPAVPRRLCARRPPGGRGPPFRAAPAGHHLPPPLQRRAPAP